MQAFLKKPIRLVVPFPAGSATDGIARVVGASLGTAIGRRIENRFIIQGFPDVPDPAEPAMPIYAYRCETCGHAKDVIQKYSDTPLSVCPACGAETFRKQLSAPSFQLKGSGWYVTDFRDNGKAKPGKGDEATPGVPVAGEAAKAESAATEGGKEAGGTRPADAPSTSAGASAAPVSTSGGSSGGGSDAAPSKPQPTT